MVDLDRLARDAQRTAEWSRARMAARACAVIVPLIAIAVIAGGAVAPCACLGALLLVTACGLRWWSREGVDAVRLGLAMGAVPLAVASLLPVCGLHCARPGQLGAAEWVCVLAGVAAGVGLAVLADRERHRWRMRTLATGVAALTATLGCVPLGVTTLVVTLASVIAAAAVATIPVLVRARS